MMIFSRRTIVGASAGTFAAACLARTGSAAQAVQCVANGLSAFLPEQLTVDCASRQNFRAFRRFPDYLSLAGTVSMAPVLARYGSFAAGNLFLFPFVKPGAPKVPPRNLGSMSVPANQTLTMSAPPIPNAHLPPDEYFCRYIMRVPVASFIGFLVETPFAGASDTGTPWFTNVEQLADSQPVGIDWTSANLNNAWFAGSNWIPNSSACDGQVWRSLIAAALNLAAAGGC